MRYLSLFLVCVALLSCESRPKETTPVDPRPPLGKLPPQEKDKIKHLASVFGDAIGAVNYVKDRSEDKTPDPSALGEILYGKNCRIEVQSKDTGNQNESIENMMGSGCPVSYKSKSVNIFENSDKSVKVKGNLNLTYQLIDDSMKNNFLVKEFNYFGPVKMELQGQERLVGDAHVTGRINVEGYGEGKSYLISMQDIRTKGEETYGKTEFSFGVLLLSGAWAEYKTVTNYNGKTETTQIFINNELQPNSKANPLPKLSF